MVNAQEWLEGQEQYNTKEKREKTMELEVPDKELEGNLNLNDFTNLKKLNCSNNKLTILDLTNCEKLKELECHNNQLTGLTLPKNCPDLTHLDITNNNLASSDLSAFSSFISLESLFIGNGDKEKVSQNICNRFYGSLEPLKNLTKLRELDISNTDISSGWEHLSDSLEWVDYCSESRPESKIKEIAEPLRWIESKQISGKQLKSWVEVGLSPNDCGFVVYLIKQGYQPRGLGLEKLKKKYNKSQGWLDKIYSLGERSKLGEIHLTEPSLEGELDLKDFINLKLIRIFPQVDETKLVFKNLPSYSEVIPINA